VGFSSSFFIFPSHLFGFHNEEEKWNGEHWEDEVEKIKLERRKLTLYKPLWTNIE
jgi:hypothetical protein